jgi:hypothetical protein
MASAFGIFVEKPLGKHQLGKQKRKDNIQMDLGRRGLTIRKECTPSGLCPMLSCNGIVLFSLQVL